MNRPYTSDLATVDVDLSGSSYLHVADHMRYC